MQNGCRHILYTAPTGSGKTLLTAHMLHTAANKGMRSLFIVHRRELINQSARAFDQEEIKYGIISSGFSEAKHHRVQLASVQTLARRISRYSQPSLVVYDEAHHLAARSWDKIFRHNSHSYHIGLTATPERLDGKGLGTYFQSMVTGPSTQTLIERGYLSPYKLYAPSNVNLEGVHTKMGDYEKHELAHAMDKPAITGNAVEHYKRLCYGKRAVVFCVSIEHSKHVVDEFNRHGINAAHVDGETPEGERDKFIEQFKAGNIQVLSNVEIFGEGFDVPAIEAAILLRPTQSLGYYLQQIGRALRPSPGKDQAILLDHVGNWSRHGLPDETHHWSLEGAAHRTNRRNTGISVKICPKCFAAQLAGATACRFCGFTFETRPREIEERQGTLEEVHRLAKRSTAWEQTQAESLEALTRLGIQRGYKFPHRWAYYVFKARQAKRLNKVA